MDLKIWLFRLFCIAMAILMLYGWYDLETTGMVKVKGMGLVPVGDYLWGYRFGYGCAMVVFAVLPIAIWRFQR